MSALTINGNPVPVFVDSGDMEFEDRTVTARRFSGAFSVVRRATMLHARSLYCMVRTNREFDEDDLLDLQELIEGDAWLTISGDLWGDESEAEAQDVSRSDGPVPGISTLTFRLVERGGDD